MASYTTPRTGNVGDIFTSAWYNGELQQNLIWAHDVLLSQGASFPGSPLTGQKHWFVSGNTRLLFTYDGTHWYSDETVRQAELLAQWQANSVIADVPAIAPLVYGPSGGTGETLRRFMSLIPTIDTTDTVKNNGMTLQGRISGEADRSGGTSSGLSLAIATASGPNVNFGSDAQIAATEVTVTGGFYTGPWGDLASGSIAGVQLVLFGRGISGVPTLTFVSQQFHLRYKL